MTDYGVLPTGFSRKPLATILAEMEASNITEFGPGVIQSEESPLGQLNGLMADLITSLWELAEDIYQSYDPDQAEGVRLDTLGTIRLINRQVLESDLSYRQAITNKGEARIDLQDISRAIAQLDGVTYYHVWVNDTNAIDENLMPPGSVCVAVIGGDEGEIGEAIRQYLVPGVSLYGNVTVESELEGYCRSFRILRPIDVPVTLTVNVNKFRDNAGCPPPSNEAIRSYLMANLDLLNGDDVSYYRIRSIIESGFSNVEVISIVGSRDSIPGMSNVSVDIGFIEKASIASLTVNS